MTKEESLIVAGAVELIEKLPHAEDCSIKFGPLCSCPKQIALDALFVLQIE